MICYDMICYDILYSIAHSSYSGAKIKEIAKYICSLEGEVVLESSMT